MINLEVNNVTIYFEQNIEINSQSQREKCIKLSDFQTLIIGVEGKAIHLGFYGDDDDDVPCAWQFLNFQFFSQSSRTAMMVDGDDAAVREKCEKKRRN
jgi:hypothetical protein